MNITHSIGLDIHKSSARYHIFDSAAHRVARGPLKAAKAAVQQLLEKLHAADPATVLVVAEATGMLHLDFCEAFEKAGCQVVAINPQMAAIAASVIPSATTRRISSTPSLWPSSDSGITKSY